MQLEAREPPEDLTETNGHEPEMGVTLGTDRIDSVFAMTWNLALCRRHSLPHPACTPR